MPDLNELIGHWGYPAIFLVVVLGNVGLPVPEETILGLAGYLLWRRELRLQLVLAVGIVRAAAAAVSCPDPAGLRGPPEGLPPVGFEACLVPRQLFGRADFILLLTLMRLLAMIS